MIWTAGRLIEPDQLVVPATDRAFEHGLGLFETFRTWAGHAPLLDCHLARLRHSCRALGIPLDESHLPDHSAIRTLAAAHHLTDASIRLTVTGGRPPTMRSTVWMVASPLPAPPPSVGYRVIGNPWPIALGDPLARHKSLNYWAKRLAYEQAQAGGFDEAIFGSSDGLVWEGSRTNLFLVRGRSLITPPADGPIVPGILRALVLARAPALGYTVAERLIAAAEVSEADEVFLTNSVRGLIPVGHWEDRFDRSADPSFPRTNELRRSIFDSLAHLRESA